MNKLKPIEKAFCLEYISNGRNGTRAYMKIRPNAKENSAGQSAFEWLNKPEILAEIERMTNLALKRAQASADQVLAELANLGFSDIGNVVWGAGERDSAGNETVEGTIKPLSQMPPAVRRSIKSIKWDILGRPEIVMWDNKGALNMLAKHHKLVDADVQVNVQLGFADRLRRAREKRLAAKK